MKLFNPRLNFSYEKHTKIIEDQTELVGGYSVLMSGISNKVSRCEILNKLGRILKGGKASGSRVAAKNRRRGPTERIDFVTPTKTDKDNTGLKPNATFTHSDLVITGYPTRIARKLLTPILSRVEATL